MKHDKKYISRQSAFVTNLRKGEKDKLFFEKENSYKYETGGSEQETIIGIWYLQQKHIKGLEGLRFRIRSNRMEEAKLRRCLVFPLRFAKLCRNYYTLGSTPLLWHLWVIPDLFEVLVSGERFIHGMFHPPLVRACVKAVVMLMCNGYLIAPPTWLPMACSSTVMWEIQNIWRGDWSPGAICIWSFLSDPGIPGVQSMGPDLSHWLTNWPFWDLGKPNRKSCTLYCGISQWGGGSKRLSGWFGALI